MQGIIDMRVGMHPPSPHCPNIHHHSKQFIMKKILLGISLLAVVSACSNKKETPESMPMMPTKETVKGISLTHTQIEKAGITVGEAERRTIAGTLTVNGTVAVLPENKATVTAKMGGRIEQFFIHEGQDVRQGQPLLSVAATALFDLQQSYVQTKADMAFLEKEVERQRMLSTEQVGAKRNYEEAQAKYTRAKGDLQLIAAKMRYLGIDPAKLDNPDQLQPAKSIVVSAPISGNISHVAVNLGASVGEGTILCDIVGLDDLHAHLSVFAKDMGQVRQGQAVTLRFPNTNLVPLASKVEYISRDMEENTKTYALHVHLPARGGYLPGMPVVAELPIQTASTEGWALPESAVIHDGNEWYCFAVQQTDGEKLTFERIAFQPTAQGGGYIGVPTALVEGKKIVLKGINIVDGELRKGDMEE